MARGEALTVAEKYAIKAMIDDGIQTSKIATHLGRTTRFIQKYIDTLEIPEEDAVEELPVDNTPDKERMIDQDIEEKAFDILVRDGMDERDAVAVLNRIKKKLKTKAYDPVAIARYCTNNLLQPRDKMITKSRGRKKGMAIMTAGASEMLDDLRGTSPVRDTSSFLFQQPNKISPEDEDVDLTDYELQR